MAPATLVSDLSDARPSGTCRSPEGARHLLLLPPEIRNEVYAYAFSYSPSTAPSAPEALEPLLTCKQILHEAHNIAFSLTLFTIQLRQVPELPSILRTLRSSQRESIRHLQIGARFRSYWQLGVDDPRCFWADLDADGLPCLKLERLVIAVSTPRASPWYHFFSDLMVSDRIVDHDLPTVLRDLTFHWLGQIEANQVDFVSATYNYTDVFGIFSKLGDGNEIWNFESNHKEDEQLWRFKMTKKSPVSFKTMASR